MITDRVSRKTKAIDNVRLSVRLSVRPSVCLSVSLFPLYLLNRLIYELKLLLCVGVMTHDHSSPKTKSQGHWPRSRGIAVGLTSILNRRQFF